MRTDQLTLVLMFASTLTILNMFTTQPTVMYIVTDECNGRPYSSANFPSTRDPLPMINKNISLDSSPPSAPKKASEMSSPEPAPTVKSRPPTEAPTGKPTAAKIPATRRPTSAAPTASPSAPNTTLGSETTTIERAATVVNTSKDDAADAPPKNKTSASPSHNTNQPKFLFGIFSTLEEVERRQFVRDSVLSFYKDTEDKDSTKICSIMDVLSEKTNVSMEDCQIAYAFIVGGLESGETRYLRPRTEDPITMPPSMKNITEEPDVVALRIFENMNEGKTPTFYKYASMVTEEVRNMTGGETFDYIVKMDLDTMLFPPMFLEFGNKNLLPGVHGRHIYSGKEVKSLNTGIAWASGALQILSTSLASDISSPDDARRRFAKHEDVDISRRIEAFGKDVTNPWIGNDQVKYQPSKTVRMRKIGPHTTYDFTNIVFGHTEWGRKKVTRATAGPFFKHLPTARKIWRHYLHWYMNDQTRVDNIYHLFDMPPKRTSSGQEDMLLVQPNDYIYSNQDFDSSPIVMEDYKLVFFPIQGNGAATWRRLFRRMLGATDWKDAEHQFEGLVYLSDFNQSKATEIMTSPNYTRAMIVQDPKTRLVAVYGKKVANDRSRQSFMRTTCCGEKWELKVPGSERYYGACAKKSTPVTLDLFVEMVKGCDQPYWRPQSRRMEPKYYKYMNFVGHYETIKKDSTNLLQKIGVWERFGKSGWGNDGTEAIFENFVPWNLTSTIPQSIQQLSEVGSIYRTDYEEETLGLPY